MTMNRYSSRLISGLMLTALLLSACGTPSAENLPAPSPSPTLSPVPTASIEPSPTTDPANTGQLSGLTGLPVQGELLRPFGCNDQ